MQDTNDEENLPLLRRLQLETWWDSPEARRLFKEINFEDQGESYHFTEKVQALTLQDFQTMMEEAGIYLLDIFGDYKLKKFHKTESERLIMIFK